jgi:hypothetical protein
VCIWSIFFDIFSDAEILWNRGGGGDGEIVTVSTSAWAHSNNKCLWVCQGVEEVARDGDVDLVGSVALAATRIQKVVTHGDSQMVLSVVIIVSGKTARAVYTNASIHRIHCV